MSKIMTLEEIETHNAPLYAQIEWLCKVAADAWQRGDEKAVRRLVEMRCEASQQLLPR